MLLPKSLCSSVSARFKANDAGFQGQDLLDATCKAEHTIAVLHSTSALTLDQAGDPSPPAFHLIIVRYSLLLPPS